MEKPDLTWSQGPRVWRRSGEAQSPSCWSSTARSFHSGMFGATWFHQRSKVGAASSKRGFHLPNSFMEMLVSFSSRTRTCFQELDWSV